MILADGPLSYWKLNDAAASTSAVDSGTGANTGTYVGNVTSVTGGPIDTTELVRSFGGSNVAPTCDGIDVAPGAFLVAGDFTIESWIKTSASDLRGLFRERLYGYNFGLSGGKLVMEVNSTNAEAYGTTSVRSVNDNAWHHVVGVRKVEGADVRITLFVDGQQDVSVLFSPSTTAVFYGPYTPHLGIGRDADTCPSITQSPMLGQMAHVAFYTKALAAADVVRHASLGPAGGSINATEARAGGDPSQQCACHSNTADVSPVNGLTGEMYHSFTDFSIPGRGVGLSFTRTYSSAAAGVNGTFGWGWTANWGASLSFFPNATSPTQITATQENGAQTLFTLAGAVWTAPPRVSARLTAASDAGTAVFDLKRSDGTTLRFIAANGRLSKLIDRNGYITTVAYDASGRLSVITEPGGRTLTLTYGTIGGATGKVVTIADSAQFVDSTTTVGPRTVAFTYSTTGELVSSKDVQGNFTRFAYEAGSTHRLTLMWDPNQNTSATASIAGAEPIETHYDATGKVDWQDDQLNRRTTFVRANDPYSFTGGTVTVTDPKGNVRRDTFRFGQRVASTAGFGTASAATTAFGYDEVTGGLKNVVDPLGHITTMRYDADGNMIQQVDALGRTTTTTYNVFDEVLTTTDPLGDVTTNTYDANGNLTKSSRLIARSNSSFDGQLSETLFEYDPAKAGDLTKVTDPDGYISTFVHDAVSGLVTQSLDPALNKTTYVYDNIGRLKLSTAPKGNVTGAPANSFQTVYTFNRHGDVLTSKDPRAKVTTYTYDKNRQRVTVKDANTFTTTMVFDKAGQLTQTTRADTTILGYQYYGDGSLFRYTDGAGAITEYTYDPLGRMLTSKDPLNRTTTYTYDLSGRQTSKLDAAGRSTTYTFDDADELTRIDYVGATTGLTFASFGFDDLGRRVVGADSSGYALQWNYDSLGRLVKSGRGSSPDDLVNYFYAGKTGRIDQTVHGPDRITKRGYDAAGRWSTLTDLFGRVISFGWDANGNVTTVTFPNGIKSTYTFNDTDAVTKVSHKKGTVVVAEFSYGRDNIDNVASATSSDTVTFGANDTYGYDNNERLLRQNAVAPAPANYATDPADNPTLLAGTTNRAQGFDTANQVCWQATPPATGTCATPPAGATTFGYDQAGNRTTSTTAGSTVTNTFDWANRLVTTSTSSLTNIYRGDGIRAQRYSPTLEHDFVWDESAGLPLLAREYRFGTQNVVYDYLYGPGGLLLETTFNNYADGQPSYMLLDQYATVRVNTDLTGTARGTRTHDPYGKQKNQTGTWNDTYGNPYPTLGWANEYTDTDTNLTYLRARHYDPTTAQFLQTDPITGGSCNTHDYTCARPLTGKDPSGTTFAKKLAGRILERYRRDSSFIDSLDCDELAGLISWMSRSLGDRKEEFHDNRLLFQFSDKDFVNHVRRFIAEQAVLEALLQRYIDLGCELLDSKSIIAVEKLVSIDPYEEYRPRRGSTSPSDSASGILEVLLFFGRVAQAVPA